jgi:hypothetical protein
MVIIFRVHSHLDGDGATEGIVSECSEAGSLFDGGRT